MSNPASIGAAILRHAESRPDSPAVVATGFEPLSYRDLRGYVARTAVRLRESGLDRSARVAVALPSGADAALAIVATACAAVAVPIDTQLTAPEIDGRLASLRPRAVIVPADGPSAARDVAMGRGAYRHRGQPRRPRQARPEFERSRGRPRGPAEEPDAAAIAFILQTSGTTAESEADPLQSWEHARGGGQSSIVVRSDASGSLSQREPDLLLARPQGDRFHAIDHGRQRRIPASARRRWMSTNGSALSGPPGTPPVRRFTGSCSTRRSRCRTSDRSIVCDLSFPAARPLRGKCGRDFPPRWACRFWSTMARAKRRRFPPTCPRPAPSKPGTCGIPAKGTVKIVAESGSEVAAGEHGEILLGGPTVTSGYLDAPELNRASFVDGWFRTGDIGSLDADGFLTLHGRKTEMINRGGEKISPAEIDDALQRHPVVAEAAAFAVPHPRLGEDVAAAVVLERRSDGDAARTARIPLAKLSAIQDPTPDCLRRSPAKGRDREGPASAPRGGT